MQRGAFPAAQRKSHVAYVGMRERPGVLCHLVRNYNRATRNNCARPRPRVIYPSHPESGHRIGMDEDTGPRAWGPGPAVDPFLFLSHSHSLSLYLSPANPVSRQRGASYIIQRPSRNCGVKPHIGDAECRGTDRIGLPCGPRRYLRSIISGIYRCRRQPRAVLRPARTNDIP